MSVPRFPDPWPGATLPLASRLALGVAAVALLLAASGAVRAARAWDDGARAGSQARGEPEPRPRPLARPGRSLQARRHAGGIRPS